MNTSNLFGERFSTEKSTINSLWLSDAIWRHGLPEGTKPLPHPMLTYCQSDPQEPTSGTFESTHKRFLSKKCNQKCCLQNVNHFVQVTICLIYPYMMSMLTHCYQDKWLNFV